MKNHLEKKIIQSGFGRLLVIYFLMILLFGTIFFLLTTTENNGIYSYDAKVSADMEGYRDSLYFSFVTSTSLGYGDITPKGMSRVLAVIEVFVSLILFGILISKLLSKNQEKILNELYKVSFHERITRIISGLYNFRAEIDRIITKVNTASKNEHGELLHSIESNLHLLSAYLTDSEKILLDAQKSSERIPDFKVDIILDNVHSSIAKLEELAELMKKRHIDWKRKPIINNMASILASTQKICTDCISPGYTNINQLTDELKRHSKQLKKFQ